MLYFVILNLRCKVLYIKHVHLMIVIIFKDEMLFKCVTKHLFGYTLHTSVCAELYC